MDFETLEQMKRESKGTEVRMMTKNTNPVRIKNLIRFLSVILIKVLLSMPFVLKYNLTVELLTIS